jgi:ribosome-associated toxin RatA of RatAB toxin-antitoxin module
MWRGVLPCLLLLLAGAGHAGTAEVRLEARREGEAVVVQASAELRAHPEVVWEVLTGYDRYAEFVPDLTSSRTLSRNGLSAVIEQHGVAGIFFYRFPMQVTLAITEEPLRMVRCQSIAGNFRELSGVYRLESGTQGVRFLYDARLVPDFRLPPLIGLPAVRASVERQFRALVQEIERRTAEEGAGR